MLAQRFHNTMHEQQAEMTKQLNAILSLTERADDFLLLFSPSATYSCDNVSCDTMQVWHTERYDFYLKTNDNILCDDSISLRFRSSSDWTNSVSDQSFAIRIRLVVVTGIQLSKYMNTYSRCFWNEQYSIRTGASLFSEPYPRWSPLPEFVRPEKR